MTESTEKLRADRAVILQRLADFEDDVNRFYRTGSTYQCRTLGISDLIGEETLILLELRKRGEA